MIAVCVLTNGRIDLLDQTIVSFEDRHRGGPVTTRVIWDDTGSHDYFEYLRLAYPRWRVARSVNGAEGFGGAMRSAWKWLDEHTTEPYIWWSEDDFRYEKPIPLDLMAATLDAQPHLAQLALRRQAWNQQEIEAGGVVEANPEAFTERYKPGPGRGLTQWLEHRLFWTTNPSLFRRQLLAGGWADDPHSEGRYTHRLLGEGLPWGVPGHEVKFGYWGSRKATPAVEHIGLERVGFGY